MILIDLIARGWLKKYHNKTKLFRVSKIVTAGDFSYKCWAGVADRVENCRVSLVKRQIFADYKADQLLCFSQHKYKSQTSAISKSVFYLNLSNFYTVTRNTDKANTRKEYLILIILEKLNYCWFRYSHSKQSSNKYICWFDKAVK